MIKLSQVKMEKLFQTKKNYVELSVLILQTQFLTLKFQIFTVMCLVFEVTMILCQLLLRRLKFTRALLILDKENLTQFLVYFQLLAHENGVRKIIKNPNVRKVCQDSDILTKIIKLNVDLVGSFNSQHFNYCISIG